MPADEGHIHWSGALIEEQSTLGQSLTFSAVQEEGDPIGTLRLAATGYVGPGLVLPNSTAQDPTWSTIPGTSPALEARQDGYYPADYTRVRVAGPAGPIQTQIDAIDAEIAVINGQIDALQAQVTNIDAAQITTGVLPYQRLAGTVPENDTVVLYNRPTVVTPGTALDSWRWLYNGIRTVYGNEFNLLRVRGVPEDQVPARFMSNAARDGLTTPIAQASFSDASSHLFQVLGNGDILSTGGLSMLPTAPVPVTFNGVAGTANAGAVSDGSTTGTPYTVNTVLEASDNRVFLDGTMATTSVSITAQTTLFTVTAAHRPTAWTQRAGRTSTGLAVRITIRPDGTVVIDQALASLATLSFDGVNWRKG